MKCLTTILFTAGLVSALNAAAPAERNRVRSPATGASAVYGGALTARGGLSAAVEGEVAGNANAGNANEEEAANAEENAGEAANAEEEANGEENADNANGEEANADEANAENADAENADAENADAENANGEEANAENGDEANAENGDEANAEDNAAQMEAVGEVLNNTNINGNDSVAVDEAQNNANNMNLDGVNIDGLNLGSVDLSNQQDVIAAILLMMNNLNLGGFFNFNSLFSLGFNNNLQLFLQLAQLMQLQQLGFLTVFDVQNLVRGGFGVGGFNGLNAFNFGKS